MKAADRLKEAAWRIIAAVPEIEQAPMSAEQKQAVRDEILHIQSVAERALKKLDNRIHCHAWLAVVPLIGEFFQAHQWWAIAAVASVIVLGMLGCAFLGEWVEEKWRERHDGRCAWADGPEDVWPEPPPVRELSDELMQDILRAAALAALRRPGNEVCSRTIEEMHGLTPGQMSVVLAWCRGKTLVARSPHTLVPRRWLCHVRVEELGGGARVAWLAFEPCQEPMQEEEARS